MSVYGEEEEQEGLAFRKSCCGYGNLKMLLGSCELDRSQELHGGCGRGKSKVTGPVLALGSRSLSLRMLLGQTCLVPSQESVREAGYPQIVGRFCPCLVSHCWGKSDGLASPLGGCEPGMGSDM